MSQSYSEVFGPKNINIGISGIIGVGKSTLTEELSRELNAEALYEPVETNLYLEKFYEDIPKYSFPMQVYLLNHRFMQHQQMAWSNKDTIQDRTIYEDVIFAKMLRESGDMDELDFNTYCDLYRNMSNFLHRPDLIVYLDVTPEKALERITHRSRDCEVNIPLEYLKNLQNGYEEWLRDIHPRIPVLRIDWNEFKSTEYVINEIRNVIKQTKSGLVL